MFISGLFSSNNNSLNTRRSYGLVVMGCAVMLCGIAFFVVFFHVFFSMSA